MKILFLAPQPFFQERGTPIAVRLAAQVLAERSGDEVHLLTYREGRDLEIPNVEHYRSSMPGFVSQVGPGISWKKLICDLWFLWAAMKMVIIHRQNQYDLVHAVEESVFIAWLIKLIFGIPYIYDMDSSLALQVTEKWRLLRPLLPVFEWFERVVIKGSTAVVPVCDALAAIANRHGSSDTHILRDISLLSLDNEVEQNENLRASLGIAAHELLIIYIGNLEPYQGIDLLIDGFATACQSSDSAHLVIIGGRDDHISAYKKKVGQLNLTDRVHLIGPRPVSSLNEYLLQADILASPRTLGNNTPMKIYSYLHAGKPIIATDLPTHTQVLTDKVAQLSAATPGAFGDNLLELITSSTLRESIGNAAFNLAEKQYTFAIFTERLNELYDRVGKRVEAAGFASA